MTTDLDSIRRDRAALEAELTGVGAVFRGNACRCPFHDDKHASAAIYADESGIWRLKCHAGSCGWGGDLFDVRAKLRNQAVEEAIRDYIGQGHQPRSPQGPPATHPKVFTLDELRAHYSAAEAIYEYSDPDSRRVQMVVIRIHEQDGKRFLQYRPEGEGFTAGGPPKPWPLYNRGRIRMNERVVVVEGEKVVHSLHGVGIVATTSPGGAKNADKADWRPLAGKTVYIWSDDDEAGIRYGRAAAGLLEKLDPPGRALWIDPTTLGLQPKGDAADFIDALADLPVDGQRQAVEEVLASAVPMGAARELHDLVEATIRGERRAIPWPWTYTSRLTKALLPGSITLLCGEGGASKSFLALQAAAWWQAQGYKVALYELEGTRAEHLNRALAQAAKDSRILDDDWLRDNGDEARKLLVEHQAKMGSFGGCIWAAPDTPPSLADLAGWVEARAKVGAEIVLVDPITAATPAEKAWIADTDFILKVKAVIRCTGTRLVVVMHPKKGHKGVGLDELAGGAVYARLAETVLWLEPHEPPAEMAVNTPLGVTTFGVNRTLRILKARHGRGTGLRLAFTFDGTSVTYQEHGTVVSQAKRTQEGRGAARTQTA